MPLAPEGLTPKQKLRWLLAERKALLLEQDLKRLHDNKTLAANMRRAITDIRRERDLVAHRTEASNGEV